MYRNERWNFKYQLNFPAVAKIRIFEHVLPIRNELDYDYSPHSPHCMFQYYVPNGTKKNLRGKKSPIVCVYYKYMCHVGVFVWSCFLHQHTCMILDVCVSFSVSGCVSQHCDHGHSGMIHVVVVAEEKTGSNNRFLQRPEMQNICRALWEWCCTYSNYN